MKAVRGAAISLDCLRQPKQAELSDEALHEKLYDEDDERLFVIFEALRRGVTPRRDPRNHQDRFVVPQ